jgi:hypothetical protein
MGTIGGLLFAGSDVVIWLPRFASYCHEIEMLLGRAIQQSALRFGGVLVVEATHKNQAVNIGQVGNGRNATFSRPAE